MGIYHDAYLFQPETFLAEITPYIDALGGGNEGYKLLRAAAMQAFDENPQVRRLADEYGGWDKKGLLEEPEDVPSSPHNIAFWLILLLYGQLGCQDNERIGLGHSERAVNQLLESAGWNKADIDKLVLGRSFKEYRKKQDDEFWDCFLPFSTCSHVGWLDQSDVGDLMLKLREDETRLKAHLTSNETLPLILKMLTRASENQSGLCIIKSG